MKAGAVFLSLALTAASSPEWAQEPGRPGSYREEARVERVIVDAYVTDRGGDPIPDLGVADFLVRVDGKPIALESAEWIPADLPELPVAGGLSGGSATHAPPGRLIVFFFQTDYVPTRLLGLVRMSLQARRFLDSLLPTDRVAVISYDSHLKLRQDFTGDRAKLEAAIHDAIRTGTSDEPIRIEYPSMAKHFDFVAARRAATPEAGLFVLARALTEIPGGKMMLYFGWGLGTIGGIGGPNYAERRDFRNALKSLAAARVSIFTLDVTDADYHTLETSLQNVSDLTGGIYQKTHIFANLAMDRVRRAISGHYVLVFQAPGAFRGQHAIEVKLADRKGEVNARQYYED